MKFKTIIIIFGLFHFSQVFAQINQDTSRKNEEKDSLLLIQVDTVNIVSDSAFVKRQEFIRDSLIAREKFVKDSLFRRKQILDSVMFLKRELPRLIEAAIKSNNEEIIIYSEPVSIVGDSSLSNFTYRILSQKIDKPFAPWRPEIALTGNSIRIKTDTITKKIISVHLPEINYSFKYDNDIRLVRMNGRASIVKKRNNNYYKYPIDSVFFDRNGRVLKIKKYIHYFEAMPNYKKGASLDIDLIQIKEYRYFSDGVLSYYKFTKYCDRWSGKDVNEICFTLSYSISRQGRKFTVVKQNVPENNYSDGTFIYEFDDNFDMKSMKFTNANKSLSRNCIVELNEERNVSRYLYEKNGRINKTILVNYNSSPDAKNKVETIVCFFEDDGISYYQKNTTTGKSRRRDKLTMKWSPWQ